MKKKFEVACFTATGLYKKMLHQPVTEKIRNYLIFILLGLLLLSAGSCHNTNGDSVKNAVDSNKAQIAETPVAFNKTDAEFTDKVADAGKTEIMQSKIAIQRTDDPTVKNFAEKMVADHSKMADSLTSVATALNITVPDSLSNDAKQSIDKLQNVKASDFDKTYIDLMVNEHEKDVDLFTSTSKTEINRQLGTFITAYLPLIQSHLSMVKTIDKKYK